MPHICCGLHFFVYRPEFPSGCTFCHPKEHLVIFLGCRQSRSIKLSLFLSGEKKKVTFTLPSFLRNILTSTTLSWQLASLSSGLHCLWTILSFVVLNGIKWKAVSLAAFQISALSLVFSSLLMMRLAVVFLSVCPAYDRERFMDL